MSSIKLLAFQGPRPRITDSLLPQEAASEAYNVRLDNGSIRPFYRSASADDPLPFSGAVDPFVPTDLFRFLLVSTDCWAAWTDTPKVYIADVAQLTNAAYTPPSLTLPAYIEADSWQFLFARSGDYASYGYWNNVGNTASWYWSQAGNVYPSVLPTMSQVQTPTFTFSDNRVTEPDEASYYRVELAVNELDAASSVGIYDPDTNGLLFTIDHDTGLGLLTGFDFSDSGPDQILGSIASPARLYFIIHTKIVHTGDAGDGSAGITLTILQRAGAGPATVTGTLTLGTSYFYSRYNPHLPIP
jgi:hypothetical protein